MPQKAISKGEYEMKTRMRLAWIVCLIIALAFPVVAQVEMNGYLNGKGPQAGTLFQCQGDPNCPPDGIP